MKVAVADSYEFTSRQVVRGAQDGKEYMMIMQHGADDVFTYAVSMDAQDRITNPDFVVIV